MNLPRNYTHTLPTKIFKEKKNSNGSTIIENLTSLKISHIVNKILSHRPKIGYNLPRIARLFDERSSQLFERNNNLFDLSYFC